MVEGREIEPLHEAPEDDGEERIAIVGLAGRFPGAADVGALWRNLEAGVDSVSRFSDEELAAAGVAPERLAHPSYVKARGVLDGAELFDAAFFGFSPREAEITDPQHRVFLECAWQALEDAGQAAGAGGARVGVYAGTITSTYLIYNLLSHADSFDGLESWQVAVGNEKDALTTRVSYKLDLRGPSISVQTACSSSLVAVHLACQALLDYQCDLALAGGVSIRFPQQSGYFHHPQGILSPDGRCRPFDEAAAGTVFGSGAGVVVLKRLADARADGDAVRAVIRGSAVNNDGAHKVGFTAPGVEGQAAVIAQALALAEVDPASLGLVEAHGTGTDLGDLIEVEALTRIFRAATAERGFCALGSVKSNVGHLDNAAGVCGLIKAVLALEHGVIPPTAHFRRPNPRLGLAESPFFVNDRPLPWPASPGRPRRAAVSSFGIGGTNAHLVLEEAPAPEPSSPSPPGQLLLLSARTPGALAQAAERLAAHLESHPDEELADVAWTLAAGRRRFAHRRAVVCHGREDAVAALRRPGPAATAEERQERPVAFLLPGQGAQHPGMLAGLYETAPAFRRSLDRAAEILLPRFEIDLRRLLFADDAGAAERLAATEVAQPALFAVELALAEQWRELGVEPEAMLGHSLGEYAAAALAGVFSPEEGLGLVAARGRLMASLPPGAMLAVPLAEAEVLSLLEERGDEALALAAVNGRERCVVSGAPGAVEALAADLRRQGVEARRLRTSHAFHSPMIEPVLEALGEELARLSLEPPQRRFLSNLTGTWIGAEEATDPSYWVRHSRAPVRFADGLAELLGEPARALLEVGPGQSLCALARRHPARAPGQPVVASARRAADADGGGGESDRERLLAAVGELWRGGVALAAAGLFAGEHRRRLPLPTYPFERRRYWLPVRGSAGSAAAAAPSRGDDPAAWLSLPSWRRTAAPRPAAGDLAGTRWLLLVDGRGVGAALAAALAAAGAQVASAEPGDAFRDRGDGRFELRPGRGDDLEALVAALDERGGAPENLVHLWSLEPAVGESPAVGGSPAVAAAADLAAFDGQQRRGLASLLPAVQALARRQQGLRVVVAASEVARVLGAEPVAPGKAALAGLCRVLPGELPGARCRLIDLGAGGDGDPESLARRLLGEIGAAAPPGGPAVVAYRGGERWVESLEPVRLAAAAGEAAASRLRAGGAYLLTGGLDGPAFALARGLAKGWAPRLALLVPAGAAAGPVQLDQLTAAGARQVEVLQADLADGAAVAAALGAAVERLGGLDGVIHAVAPPAAGRADEPVENAVERCAPLVRGALHLDRLLAGGTVAGTAPPAFLVLLSPLAAAVGGAGELPAAAAGAVLGALADGSHAAGGRPFVLAVDARLATADPAAAAAADDGSLGPERAWSALESLLAGLDERRVVVCPVDPAALRRALARPPEEEAPAAPAAHPRPHLETAFTAPSTPLEERLAAAWGQALGVEGVGAHDDFFDLGGDSLLALQLAGRLRQVFPVEIGPRDLFEQPTVARLAELLDRRLLERLEAMPEEEAERLAAVLAGEA